MTIDEPYIDDVPAVRSVPQPPEQSRHRLLPFTSVAVVTSLALLVTESMAINLANTGNPAAATGLAQWLNWLTVIPFVLGAIALVRGPHRVWAFAAMIVSVIANPFILLNVLSFFESL
ncbi:MAG: hypothetical protein ABIW32_01195 [Terrimesophilobacter sp.]